MAVEPHLGLGPRGRVEALEGHAEAEVALQHPDPDGVRARVVGFDAALQSTIT